MNLDHGSVCFTSGWNTEKTDNEEYMWGGKYICEVQPPAIFIIPMTKRNELRKFQIQNYVFFRISELFFFRTLKYVKRIILDVISQMLGELAYR